MSWPKAKHEKVVRARYEREEKILDKMDQIKKHFDGRLLAFWLEDAFSGKRLLKIDLDILLKKFGFCEFCEGYIGTSPLLRKRKNISVLSSYCETRLKKVTPEERCQYYVPREPYTSIILNELWKTCGYTLLDSWQSDLTDQQQKIINAYYDNEGINNETY